MASIKGKKISIETHEDLKKVKSTQEAALELTRLYLVPAIKQIDSTKYSDIEIACAFIMLAFNTLRQKRAKKNAEDSWVVLTHFAKERIEKHIETQEKKPTRLH